MTDVNNELLVHLIINGEERALAVRPNVTLLEVIRHHLGLTGTKRGCGTGDCGACTVLADGKPVNACLMLAVSAEGLEITTVEGLALGGDLHPLQQSFVKHAALQCGYCTSGALMSAKALVDATATPTEDEINTALSGNLCRCGTYPRIRAAIAGWREFSGQPYDLAPRDHGECDQHRDHEVVGRGVPRTDAVDKVTGRAKYTADYHLPGMIFGKILGSPIAHGRITRINVDKARALPGVVAVLTSADVPDGWYGVSPAREDEQILARDRVRYIGDEIAAVAAIDEATAERALQLIEVEFEELPAVFDPDAAMAPGAPVIHPEKPRYAGNINTRVDWSFGDLAKGFAEADLVREQRFIGNRTYQAPMEPHATLAQWDHHGNRLTIWASTQTPHYLHRSLSRMLDLPMGQIRVIRPTVGGGFGAKAEATPLEFCAAILARQTGRPVMMEYSREEMFRHFRGRHKQYIDLKIGVTKDGRITAVDQRIVLDGGAYTSFGVITAYYAGSMLPTLYQFPSYRYEGVRVYTNLPASGAFRGHGVPQPRFAFESLLDMIAEELGLDPIEVRLKNAMTPDTHTVNGLDVTSCEFRATLERAREVTDWRTKKGSLPKGRGIGVGCGGFVSGAGYPIYRSDFPHSNAMIRVHEDGTGVSLHIAATEIGQGSDTVLCQMAAEALGIPYSCVWMAECDTTLSPLDLGSYSSRVTLMAGHAVQRAGTVINPLSFHGQVEGSIVMGLGETLFEDTLFDASGRLLNPNLHDYLVPSISECPEIRSVAVESYEPNGPFGAKEVGEGSLLPVLGAIANAVYDACGVRVTELPITPEKILRGLRERTETSGEAIR